MRKPSLILAATITVCNLSYLSAEDSVGDTLSTLVVTGTRQPSDQRSLPFSITTIDRDKLTQSDRTDIMSTLTELTPGLYSTSRSMMGYGVGTGSAGSFKIRGIGGGARTLVLIDGQPQYAALMGHPLPDVYQTMLADKVEVMQGPASMLYGSNAMGGVVNIITRQPQSDGHYSSISSGAGSYGTVQVQATEQQRLGRFASTAGVQYQRTDGHRKNSAFDQWSAMLKAGYDVTSHWKVTANAIVSHYNSSNPGTVASPLTDNDARITRVNASLAVSNRYRHSNGSLQVTGDWGNHTINDGYSPSQQPKDYRYRHHDQIVALSWFQSASLFKGSTITLGADWIRMGGKAWNKPLDGGEPTWLTTSGDGHHLITQDEVGAYADIRQDLTKWITLDAGLRVSHHNRTGTTLAPQGGIAAHLSRLDELKAFVSKGFRNPTIREMYMFPPKNPDLLPEKMTNYELAYTHSLKDGRGHLSANLFLSKGDNMIVTTRSGGRPLKINTGGFTHYGMELAADCRLDSHWSLCANYSYLHMSQPIEGAPEGKLYLGGTYRLKQFRANVGLTNVSGLCLSSSQASEKENYTLLDAHVSYQVIRQLRLWLRGENLLAERYQTYLGFPMPKATFMAGVELKF